MTRTHIRRLNRLNKQLEETTPLLKGLDILKQIEAIPINTKYYFLYQSLKRQFSSFIFNSEHDKLFADNGPYRNILGIEATTEQELEEILDSMSEEEQQAADRLFESCYIENQIFNEWIIESRVGEIMIKANNGSKTAYEEVGAIKIRFYNAAYERNSIPEDLKELYAAMREKVEIRGGINL